MGKLDLILDTIAELLSAAEIEFLKSTEPKPVASTEGEEAKSAAFTTMTLSDIQTFASKAIALKSELGEKDDTKFKMAKLTEVSSLLSPEITKCFPATLIMEQLAGQDTLVMKEAKIFVQGLCSVAEQLEKFCEQQSGASKGSA